jgi:diaminohydroxyphosphoribosylaminopyrimidine deaminase/5-amino-6-(5-phosphoribosylamino)uracil reductase
MEFSAQDHAHMARALALAARGMSSTQPNPRVGCVLVRDGAVIGEGFHARAGQAHAEVEALRAAGAKAKGATAFVTLEPCSHHGRTPPCTDALLAAGVAEVVAPIVDPNPKVAGTGFAALERAGVKVRHGLMAKEAAALNAGFIKRMTTGRPFVRLKLGMSLDGRTALASGESRSGTKWITGPEARSDVQRLRARSGAIVTGIGTVLADDPQLNARDAAGQPTAMQPLRVVLDSRLKIPADARVLAAPGRALVFTAAADAHHASELTEAHAEVCALPAAAGRVPLVAVLDELGRREVNEVLVEAGATLSGAFLAAGLVDEVVIYMAPLLLGDGARGAFALPALASLDAAPRLELVELRAVGRDWRITARPAPATMA